MGTRQKRELKIKKAIMAEKSKNNVIAYLIGACFLGVIFYYGISYSEATKGISFFGSIFFTYFLVHIGTVYESILDGTNKKYENSLLEKKEKEIVHFTQKKMKGFRYWLICAGVCSFFLFYLIFYIYLGEKKLEALEKKLLEDPPWILLSGILISPIYIFLWHRREYHKTSEMLEKLAKTEEVLRSTAKQIYSEEQEQKKGEVQETDKEWDLLCQNFPEVIEEMKKDVRNPDFDGIRKFFIKEKTSVVNTSEPHFEYYPESHHNLTAAVNYLEDLGYIEDITPGNCPMYRMREHFVDKLKSN